MITRILQRFERYPAPKVGAIMLVLLMVVGVALFKKTEISTALSRGDDMKVTFARDYQLRSYVTKVKVAGVRVGLVTGVDNRSDGTVVATLHLNKGVVGKLGDDPGAAIRPTTLLGGNYYVELSPGGDPGAVRAIPASRTTVPVELDRVLETLQPRARVGVQRTVKELDGTLAKPGKKAVRHLVSNASSTLQPLGVTMTALQGEDDGDLESFITHLETTIDVLSEQRQNVDTSVSGLARISQALSQSAPQVSAAVRELPATLTTTRAGLGALSTTLDELKNVSHDELPTAHQLSSTLSDLEPALRNLRPVVQDLRPALADLRPTVTDLVPAAVEGTDVVNGINGKPIQRVNGPIVSALNHDWHETTGPYANGGSNTVMYKELGYMIAGMDNSARMTDRNGSTIHFQPGFGIGSLSGTPISFEQLLMKLAYPGGAK